MQVSTKLILLIFVSIDFISVHDHVANAHEEEYEFDDDSLEMFPKPKKKKTEEIDKNEICESHCAMFISKNEIDICSKYLPNKENSDKRKAVYTADGVYSYYKKFVHRFLEIINSQEIIDSLQDGYTAHFKLKVDLEKYQLEKLIAFSQYETLIENSSIQDVTHALNAMIYDYEQFEPQSRVGLLLERFQNFLGVDLMSLLIAVVSAVGFVLALTLTLKSNLLKDLNWLKILRLMLIIGFLVNCVTNYFMLKKKQEIIKRAHLLSKVPAECTNMNLSGENESSGFFSRFTNMFKVTAKSKECLDHAEAMMIDSFYHIGIFQVITYTALEILKQIAIASGEAINEFYNIVGKDVNFIERSVLRLTAGVFMITIIVLLLCFVFCNECNILGGLFSTKRRRQEPIIREEDVRKKAISDLYNRLALELSHTHRVKLQALKENENVEDVVKNIEACVQDVKREGEQKAIKAVKKIMAKTKEKKKQLAFTEEVKIEEMNELKQSSSSESVEILDLEY